MTSKIDLLAPNSVICLMAPTASGKTALAYQLYETGRFELISVDSALVYRDMNIGTAKPTQDELAKYPHHLVDIIDPTESYSVADFSQDVAKLVDDIHGRNKIPLLIGGTMMYYMALFEGLSNVPNSDANIRAEVEAWRKQAGIEALHNYLKQVDPILGARLPVNDTQRITRAIEVYKQTGKPLSKWQAMPKVAIANNPNQQWYGLTVMPDRAWVHERIALRLDIMWAQGLVAEVIALILKYRLTPNMASMRSVGYRQVIACLLSQSIAILNDDNVLTIAPAIYDDAFNAVIKPHSDTIPISALINQLINPIANSLSNSTDHNASNKDKNDADDNTNNKLDEAQQEMRNKSLYATRQLAKRQYTWLRKFTATSDSDKSKSSLCNSRAQFINFASMFEAEQFLTSYL